MTQERLFSTGLHPTLSRETGTVWSPHSTADIPVSYCFLKKMHSVPVCFWFEAWIKQKSNNYLPKLLYFLPFKDFSFPLEASVHSFFFPCHFFQSHFFVRCLLEMCLVHSSSRLMSEFIICVSWDEGEEQERGGVGGGKEQEWVAVSQECSENI